MFSYKTLLMRPEAVDALLDFVSLAAAVIELVQARSDLRLL
jgi:hypothetical protein